MPHPAPRPSVPRLPIAAVVVLLAALPAACSSSRGGPASPEVARVGDRAITRAELDEWIEEELFLEASDGRNPSRLYELRADALERMIDATAIEAAAAERGVSEDILIEQEIEALGPVGDDEIEAFYEAHRDRIPPDADLERLREDIRRHLEEQRRARATAEIRSRASVRVQLEPPRAEVAAAGPSLGPADAPVTLIEFSDYQCPFCRRAEPTVRELLERYEGRLRLVFRHLPLDFHERARPAAVAAVCAERQGRFWDYHALLFEHQDALADPDLRRYAEELSLDLEAFQRCREGDEADDAVEADVRAAARAGASGTPAFFVNGILLTGARPVEAFAEVIDRELARAGASGGP